MQIFKVRAKQRVFPDRGHITRGLSTEHRGAVLPSRDLRARSHLPQVARDTVLTLANTRVSGPAPSCLLKAQFIDMCANVGKAVRKTGG